MLAIPAPLCDLILAVPDTQKNAMNMLKMRREEEDHTRS